MKGEAWDSLGKLLLRLSVGGLMIFHGVYKLIHGHQAIENMLANNHLPKILVYGVPVGEVLAPVLLVIGLWSRLAGLVVAVNMAVAMYLAFGAASFALNQTGGINTELNLLYLCGGLAIFCLGAGKYSVSRGSGTWD